MEKFKAQIINIIGNIPNNVKIKTIDGTDESISIYFKNDNNLYLYDAKLECEFNLFELFKDESQEYNSIRNIA